jgi:multiple sugar transport system substrate-binding protein
MMKIIQPLKSKFLESWRRSHLFRRFTLAIAFVLSTLLVVIPAMSQQPVVLSFLVPAPDTPPLRPVIEAFEKENPGIKLNMIEGPNASNLVEDLYTSAFLLGSAPYDLINLDVVWTPKFAAAGWLRDLTNEFPKEELSQHLEGDINGSKYEDKLYRVPWRTDAGLFYYREDLLQKIGAKPPETFADLMRISKELKQDGAIDWGFLWQGRQYEGVATVFVEVLEGNGGFWVNPDTKEVGLDRPESVEAVKFLLSTIQEGVSPPGVTTYIEEDTRRLFQNGRAAFMRNWPYAYPIFNGDESPVKGKVGIKPMVHAQGQSSAACLGGWGWGISTTTRHPKEALKAVQYLTGAEAQRQYALKSGWLPSRPALYSDAEILGKYPFYSEVLGILEKTALRPPIAQYAQASDILQRYLSATFSGRISPEDAMKSAAKETRALLGRIG